MKLKEKLSWIPRPDFCILQLKLAARHLMVISRTHRDDSPIEDSRVYVAASLFQIASAYLTSPIERNISQFLDIYEPTL